MEKKEAPSERPDIVVCCTAPKDTGAWRLKRIALVAYAVATAVGMFYGRAYYEHFGISLLDYASPIDLLFIALANLNDVVVAGVTAPLLFLCLCLVVLVVMLILYYIPFVLGMLGWTVLLLGISIVGVLACVVSVARGAALRAYWLQAALAAVRADRRESAERVRAVADQEDLTKEGPLRLTVAYQRASQHAPAWTIIDPQPYWRFVHECWKFLKTVGTWGKKHGIDVWKDHVCPTVRKIGGWYFFKGTKESSWCRWRFKSWRAIDLDPKGVVVVLALVFLACLLWAASQNGTADAAKLLKEAHGTANSSKSQRRYLWEIALRPDYLWQIALRPHYLWKIDRQLSLPLDDTGGPVQGPLDVFIVPTENLASLDFSDCPDETGKNERRLFSRANFRQDAGGDSRYGTPECLLRLGGIGKWQFLADIQNGGRREHRTTAHIRSGEPRDPVIFVVDNRQQSNTPPPQTDSEAQDAHPFVVVLDGETGAVSTPACKLKLTAVVGPFPTGGEELESNGALTEPPKCKIEGKDWELERIGGRGKDDHPAWLNRIKKNPSEMVVLVGRADVRPINNSKFTSNMNLATARRIGLGRNLRTANVA